MIKGGITAHTHIHNEAVPGNVAQGDVQHSGCAERVQVPVLDGLYRGGGNEPHVQASADES